MKLGKRDRKIELFEQGPDVDDGFTTLPGSWVSQGFRKAEYMPAMSKEVFEVAGKEGKFPVVFKVHADSVTKRIDQTWELEYANRRYEILGVREIERSRELWIDAVGQDNI